MLPTTPKPLAAPSTGGGTTMPARPGMPFPQQRPTTIKAQAPRPNPVAVKPPAFAQATPQGVQQAAQQAMKLGGDTAAAAREGRRAVLYGLGAAEYGPDVAALFGKTAGEGEEWEGTGGGGGEPGSAARLPFPLAFAGRWGARTKTAANGAVMAASVPPQPQPPGTAAPMGGPTFQPGVAPTPAGGVMPPGVSGPTDPGGQPMLGAMPAPGGPMGGPPMSAPPPIQPPAPGQPALPPTTSPTDAPVPNLAADLVGQGKEQRTTVGDAARAAGPNSAIKTALFGPMGRQLGRVGSGYRTVQVAPDRFVPKPRPPLPAPQPLFQQIRAALQQRAQPYGPYGLRPFAGWNKLSGDYTFAAEDCPACGVAMEGDSYTGTCNSCGHKWGTKAAAAVHSDAGVYLGEHDEMARRLADSSVKAAAGNPVAELLYNTLADEMAARKFVLTKAAATRTADEGGEDAPAGPGSPMRGWQWKVLQRDQAEAQKAWMPRVFKSDATPLTELLASPGKQSVLGGLAGGALGAGAGLALNRYAQTGLPDWQTALVGGGLGALAGGLKAYGSRRHTNDMVTDALRRTPPGATVKDYKAVQEADRAAEKRAMDDCYAHDCRPVGNGRCSCGGACRNCARSSNFEYRDKRAAHGGDLAGPVAVSASGESEGLSFADAGPIRNGKDAWDDVSKYFRGHAGRATQPNPFIGKHAGDLPAMLKRLGLRGTAGDPLASPSSPNPGPAAGGDARTKAAEESGAMTTLGGAGLAAAGAGGVAAAGAGGLAAAARRHLSGFANKLKAADPYDPKAAARVRDFQAAVGGAATPAERFVNYADHGSRLMGTPAFRGGATGRDVMEKVYNNPLLRGVARRFVDKPEQFTWSPGKAQHYGEFAKGPVRAAEQLAREIHGEGGHAGLTAQAREAVRGRTATQAGRVRAKLAPGLEAARATAAAARGTADATVSKVEAALRRAGKLGEGQTVWDSPFRAKAQLHHDRVDAGPQARLAALTRRAGLAGDVEGVTDRRLGRGLAATGALDPTTQAVRFNLNELAGGQRQNLDTLAHGDQRGLLERFAKTRAGGELADTFARKWDGPIAQYRGLGDAMLAPKRVIDAAGGALDGAARRAGGVARGAGKAGLASLALAVPSGLAYAAGKGHDAAARDADQQRLADRFAAAVRGTKHAADMVKAANPGLAAFLAQGAQRAAPQAGRALGNMFGRAAPAATQGAGRQLAGQVAGQALPSLGGGIGGYFAADSHGQNPWAGAAAGAAAFNPYLGRAATRFGPALATPVHAVRGAVGGNLAGSAVDLTAGQFGVDTGGRFGRMGTYLGGGLGAARGVGGAMARSSLPATAQAGRAVQNAGRQGGATVGNFSAGTFDPITGGLRRGANWLTGGRFAGPGGMLAAPTQAAGTARRLGQAVGGAGLAAGAGGMALGAIDRKIDDKASEIYGAGLGAFDEYADQKFNQYAAQAPRALAGGMVHSLTDPALQALGMNPSTVHPMQRALMLGGAGLGAAGLAAGSPVLGGLGALGAGAGYMANRHNPLLAQQPQPPGFDPRNELAHQQQLQQFRQPPPEQGWL